MTQQFVVTEMNTKHIHCVRHSASYLAMWSNCHSQAKYSHCSGWDKVVSSLSS